MTRAMTKARFSRRALLGSALAGSIGLPFLEAFSPKTARAATDAALRFVTMFSPNGTVLDAWTPVGSETDFVLPEILTPLAPHQSDLVIVSGVDQQGGGGDGHQNGMGGMLTGQPLLSGSFAGVGAPPAGWAAGPSVDQRIADVIGRGLPFRSLELGVQTGRADNWGRMCYRGRNQPLPPRDDPARAFDEVFGGAALDPDERARIKARRGSILDHVKGEIGELQAELGEADRARLEAHLSYLREVETRLNQLSDSPATCELPARPELVIEGNDAFPAVGAAQIDLIVLALSCGQTRVASLQWSRSVSEVRHTWLDIEEGHHGLSHAPDSDAVAHEKLRRINQWYAGQFASLVEKLKAVPEGEGTLFDHCLLFWANELGTGNIHSRKDAPYVLAAGAGAALRTGRFLAYSGDVPHNNLLVSILNAMGIPDTTFGAPEWCTGPLEGLV
jgi:hypothetical protein